MMSVKKTMLTSLIALSMSVPLFAHAGDLTIHNATAFDATCKINGNCSTILGDIGVTPAGKTNKIPSSQINLACIGSAKECVADVYLTNNCTGPVIATATINTKDGIQKIGNIDPAYQIAWSPFEVTISPA